MEILDKVHSAYVYGRRVQVLCDHFVRLIPSDARVLDVGCGDGWLTHLIAQQRPDICITGIDVLVRQGTRVPVEQFDGQTIPYAEKSCDAILFVDVLHHTDEPMILLREATRVAKQCILIKDHLRNGLLAGSTLRFMDWIGNARHGVALPYNYWARQEWDRAVSDLEVAVDTWETKLGLYPKLIGWFFERRLHFIARLDVKSVESNRRYRS